MSMYRFIRFLLVIPFALTSSVSAQDAPGGFKDGFLGRYNYAAMRLVSLADALPAEKYGWRPGDGVMSVERVYMHLIRYNYLYPEMAGFEPPAGIDLDHLEELTGKDTVLHYLEDSLEYVRTVLKTMSAEDLHKTVVLYGNDTQAFNVFLQLQVHMGEHLGQLIAYSRMNGITPPWSR